jgi:hypothetical protein
MDSSSSKVLGDAGLRAGAGPLLALVLVGLFVDVARPEEAYAA